eukprot:GEMP01057233.1.p1 GENE.GEMP01057233.1~~GEMP01057233.1.p1  ORF type:complete len:407 (+),score=70.29 GEMP01057233.1:48-1223(+)
MYVVIKRTKSAPSVPIKQDRGVTLVVPEQTSDTKKRCYARRRTGTSSFFRNRRPEHRELITDPSPRQERRSSAPPSIVLPQVPPSGADKAQAALYCLPPRGLKMASRRARSRPRTMVFLDSLPSYCPPPSPCFTTTANVAMCYKNAHPPLDRTALFNSANCAMCVGPEYSPRSRGDPVTHNDEDAKPRTADPNDRDPQDRARGAGAHSTSHLHSAKACGTWSPRTPTSASRVLRSRCTLGGLAGAHRSLYFRLTSAPLSPEKVHSARQSTEVRVESPIAISRLRGCDKRQHKRQCAKPLDTDEREERRFFDHDAMALRGGDDADTYVDGTTKDVVVVCNALRSKETKRAESPMIIFEMPSSPKSPLSGAVNTYVRSKPKRSPKQKGFFSTT